MNKGRPGGKLEVAKGALPGERVLAGSARWESGQPAGAAPRSRRVVRSTTVWMLQKIEILS
jgi:hypothetical protein